MILEKHCSVATKEQSTSSAQEQAINYIGKETTADYIVEIGTNYRKWSSGKAECWGRTSLVSVADNKSVTQTVSYPFTFTDINSINVTAVSTASDNVQNAYVTSVGMSNFVLNLQNKHLAALTMSAYYYVLGRWK